MLLSLSACAHGEKTAVPAKVPKAMQIAVLPLENLTRAWAPLEEIRRSLIDRLRERGYTVLDEDSLQQFMARHRMRYVGGIDEVLAEAFLTETGTGAVLVTSMETYRETDPPKVTLISRLVATGRNPQILWMDGAGLAGDDSPGILGLGLIEDPVALRGKAVGLLMASFDRYQAAGGSAGLGVAEGSPKIPSKFRPEVSYDARSMVPGRTYTVAVVPFTNLSERPTAGEILALDFVLQLSRGKNFRVVEPGIVRQRLLNLRIIIPDGPSLVDADLLFNSLDTDLILTGKVIAYTDYEGWSGDTKANFSVMMMERQNRKIVWFSKSDNKGSDTVVLFDWGKINTMYGLVSRMAGTVVRAIVR